jgi:hypothetical protein
MDDRSTDPLPEDAEAEESVGTSPGSLQSRLDAVSEEIRTHPFGYSVMAAFVLAGPVVASYLFPQAPTGVAVIGGLAFGVFSALCAVPGKFI